MPHLINPGAFADLDQLAERYRSAAPFSYVVIDDFLHPDMADAIHDEVRRTGANVDASNEVTQRLKVACTDWNEFGALTGRLIATFNSAPFIDPLEKITGIDGLLPDPWLEGGGIHLTSRGGFLKMHTDFNWNAKLRADRRINILLYLNKDWEPGWKGELLLAREGEPERPTAIAPLFNRLLIFNTNDGTLHGLPEPLQFPTSYPRASIAMYYYTSGKHVERKRGRATTTRYVPLGKGDIPLDSGSLKARIGYLARRFIPGL